MKSRQSIYEIGIIRFYPMRWKMVSYINLVPTRNLGQSTYANQRRVFDNCKKIQKLVSFDRLYVISDLYKTEN